jgi:ABC-type transport system substrate-binding protein
VEQNLRPDVPGGSAPFFRNQLERIETPDKLTVVMHFKNRVWEVPSHFTQFVGYQNITSKKYLETVGEEKAALHPIGTGPYRHVEGKQGDYHRFEAVASHWRKAPGFKELVIRRIPDAAARAAGLRSGEIDIGQVFGDYLDQTRKAGLRIHETPNAACYWVVLQGQTTPDREDYCPTCPWVGDPGNAESLAKARKVRMALNRRSTRRPSSTPSGRAQEPRPRSPISTIRSTRATARTGRFPLTTPDKPGSCWGRRGRGAVSRSG